MARKRGLKNSVTKRKMGRRLTGRGGVTFRLNPKIKSGRSLKFRFSRGPGDPNNSHDPFP